MSTCTSGQVISPNIVCKTVIWLLRNWKPFFTYFAGEGGGSIRDDHFSWLLDPKPGKSTQDLFFILCFISPGEGGEGRGGRDWPFIIHPNSQPRWFIDHSLLLSRIPSPIEKFSTPAICAQFTISTFAGVGGGGHWGEGGKVGGHRVRWAPCTEWSKPTYMYLSSYSVLCLLFSNPDRMLHWNSPSLYFQVWLLLEVVTSQGSTSSSGKIFLWMIWSHLCKMLHYFCTSAILFHVLAVWFFNMILLQQKIFQIFL